MDWRLDAWWMNGIFCIRLHYDHKGWTCTCGRWNGRVGHPGGWIDEQSDRVIVKGRYISAIYIILYIYSYNNIMYIPTILVTCRRLAGWIGEWMSIFVGRKTWWPINRHTDIKMNRWIDIQNILQWFIYKPLSFESSTSTADTMVRIDL